MHIPTTQRAFLPEMTSFVPCSARLSRCSRRLCMSTSGLIGRAPCLRFSRACLCRSPSCCTSTANGSAWLASAPATIMNKRVRLPLGYHFFRSGVLLQTLSYPSDLPYQSLMSRALYPVYQSSQLHCITIESLHHLDALYNHLDFPSINTNCFILPISNS